MNVIYTVLLYHFALTENLMFCMRHYIYFVPHFWVEKGAEGEYEARWGVQSAFELAQGTAWYQD